MALTGEFKELSFADIIQTYCITNQTVRILTAYANGENGIFYIENGQIVDAQLGSIRGTNAFFKALHHKDGKFQIDLSILTDYQSITLDWKTLLFEGMRLLDEHQLNGGEFEVQSEPAAQVEPEPPVKPAFTVEPIPQPQLLIVEAAETTADKEQQMSNAFDLAALISQDAAVKNSNGFSVVRQMLTAPLTNGTAAHQANGIDLSIIGIDYEGDKNGEFVELAQTDLLQILPVEDETIADPLDAQHLIDEAAVNSFETAGLIEIQEAVQEVVQPDAPAEISPESPAPFIEQLISESVAEENEQFTSVILSDSEQETVAEETVTETFLQETLEEIAPDVVTELSPEPNISVSETLAVKPTQEQVERLIAHTSDDAIDILYAEAAISVRNTSQIVQEIAVEPEAQTIVMSHAPTAIASEPPTPVQSAVSVFEPTRNEQMAVISNSEMEHDLLLRELLSTGVVQSGVVIDEDGSILCEIGDGGDQIAKLAFLIQGLEAVVLPGFGLGDFNGAVLEVNSQALMITRSNNLSCAFFRPSRVPKVRAFDEVNKAFNRVFNLI